MDGVQPETEYYAADSFRRTTPGFPEHKSGRLVHEFVSDGIAVFGDKFALDERELASILPRSFGDTFKVYGFNAKQAASWVYYSVRNIYLNNESEPIEVKTILDCCPIEAPNSRPNSFNKIREWVISKLGSDDYEPMLEKGINNAKCLALTSFYTGSSLAHEDGLLEGECQLQLDTKESKGEYFEVWADFSALRVDQVNGSSNTFTDGDSGHESLKAALAFSEEGLAILDKTLPNQESSSREVRVLSEPLPGFLDWLYEEFPVDDEEDDKGVR
jgi:hypothetical protein